MAGVAHLVFGVGVPRGVGGVDLEGHLVGLHGEAHVVEEEEFRLGAVVGDIADAGGLEVGFGLLGGAARVALIRFAGVGLDHGAMNAEGLLGVERVDIGRGGVDHEFHVGRFDRLPPRDGGAVEHEAFLKEVFVDEVGVDGDVLEFAAHVGKADIDIGDVFVLDHLENVSVAHCGIPCLV